MLFWGKYRVTCRCDLQKIPAGLRGAWEFPLKDFGANVVCQNRFGLPKSIDKSSKTNQFPLKREYFKRWLPSGPVCQIFEAKVLHNWSVNVHLKDWKRKETVLRTFARNFSNIDFFLKILPVKVDELVMSEMWKNWGGHRLRFRENMPASTPKSEKIGLR